ncbi:MAG: hypothetical protein ABL904_01635 [Hyphomicrobiaceae bacterium]
MSRRSGFPDLREADELSQKQIEQEIGRLKIYVDHRAHGASKHQATRKLANWERVLERRFGVAAPVRPNRSGKT